MGGLRLYLLVASASCLAACAVGGSAPSPEMAGLAAGGPVLDAAQQADAQIRVAVRFMETLVREEYDKAGADFDEGMQSALPPPALEKMWKDLLGKTGAFRSWGRPRKEEIGSAAFVFVPCNFEKTSLDAKVVVTIENKVTGLWFETPSAPPTFEHPPYADLDRFEEKDVTVGEGEWALPGTLSLPVGGGPFPGVVLIHGSGPNDRDETIGPNKPFRDLAWGLASNGIAVLRYEKRTREHAAKLMASTEPITVRAEAIDDAVTAFSLLRASEGVDAERSVLLGHSLGGFMIPTISLEATEAAGVIVMAGPTRPPEDLILDQVKYLAELDGTISEREKKNIELVEKGREAIRALDPAKPEGSARDLMGAPPEYWLGLREIRPADLAGGVKVPMLILQGERDYQVRMVDFEGWKKALSGRDDVVLKAYPKLNHLFMSGEGKARPGEYGKPGHVSEEVVLDIARWIKKLSR